MKKFWEIFKANISLYFVYRLSFFLWRVRNVFNFILIYFLWSSVYGLRENLFSYTKEQMITYVLGISIMNAIILATRTTDISSDIVNGNIINQMLKPFPFLSFVVIKELADKAINSVAAIFEVALLLIVFHPAIFIQTDLFVYFWVFVALIIGAVIAFFLSISLSFVAFWTAEIWAPRFIYFILISLLAGTFFPLDILPKSIYNALLLTPFPYLIYLPIKIYLTGFSIEILKLIVIGSLWALAFYLIAKLIWKRGIMQFSFYGK